MEMGFISLKMGKDLRENYVKVEKKARDNTSTPMVTNI